MNQRQRIAGFMQNEFDLRIRIIAFWMKQYIFIHQ
jgi:hypothetical protein